MEIGEEIEENIDISVPFYPFFIIIIIIDFYGRRSTNSHLTFWFYMLKLLFWKKDSHAKVEWYNQRNLNHVI